MNDLKDFLWVEKYRPKRVEDCILPQLLKTQFAQYVAQKNVPNLLLTGSSGTGKTTVARAMLDELDCESIVINGSLDNGIDVLRNRIREFASTTSLVSRGRKYIILDEADFLNPNSTQPALRNFMEEYSKLCGFILTANYSVKILPALKSRCAVVEFRIPTPEKAHLAAAFMKRASDILNAENIPFDKAALAGLVKKHFPDWRRCLGELQAYSATGAIDAGILANLADENLSKIIEYMKDRNFTAVMKWCYEQSNIEPSEFYTALYYKLKEVLELTSLADAVLIIAEYSYRSAFAASQEINMIGCLASLMKECHFR